jgi:hypothetical protein
MEKIELDRALELAVLSSWQDLVKPGEGCSVRVEYKDVPDIPLKSLEIWSRKGRGYGILVCRYSVAPAVSASAAVNVPTILFANSYHSRMLADHLDFIMRHQDCFARPSHHSAHGLVEVEHPSEKDLTDATAWSQSLRIQFVETVWN